MEIIKTYRHNEALRRSFNALAEKTFGLNFENWYQNGFWGENYNPYSVVMDGEVIANVSLNRTNLLVNGEVKRVYQLGTVMTDEAYRNQGLIRAIMAEIEKDTADADGVYLFANDEVVDFYPKFGITRGNEFICTREVKQDTACTMKPIPMDSPAQWAVLNKAMESSCFREGCRMVDNPGLIFFYVSQFMQDCVYFCEDLDAYVIAEVEDGNLLIHNIFSGADVSLDAVIRAFGSEIHTVTLGFTPASTKGFTVSDYHEEDSTFFVKGSFFREFSENSMRIPSLSHA